MANPCNDLELIGDTLIDHDAVARAHLKLMRESYESYKRANVLLGYFSQLRDYRKEYECLSIKVLNHRQEFLERYRTLLMKSGADIFKHMLITPATTEWHQQGINKYKKVKNYSTYYYRRKLYIALEAVSIDKASLKKIIDTIILLDKYYDIYDETIGFFMQTSARFEQLMRQHFSDCIHL